MSEYYLRKIKPPPDRECFSPWAERLGLSAACLDPAFQKGPLFHSGYAPEHALYYADKPDTSSTGTFHNNSEIDKVFYADAQRSSVFPFVELWQLGPLSQSLKFSDQTGSIPGGNKRLSPGQTLKSIAELISQGEMITPDEQTWFDFFKKDRWCDGHVAVPILGDKPYSIDHPEVGFYMSIVIELANRILNALIQEKHPLLLNPSIDDKISDDHGDNVPNVKGQIVLLSYNRFEKDRNTCDPRLKAVMESSIQHSPYAYRRRLETLLSELRWGFTTGVDQGVYGMMHRSSNGVITINGEPLASLFGSRATPAERCFKILHTAIIVSHSIMVHRQWGNKRLMRLQEGELSEPFVDFHGTAEIGHAFEQAVFGAVILPINVSSESISLGLLARGWPYPWTDQPLAEATVDFIKGHEDFDDGKIIELALVPAEFASKLLSEAFWNDATIPRKSDNYFHRRPIFISRFPNEKSKYLGNFCKPLGIDPSLDLNLLSLSEKKMIESWRENEDIWNSSRANWYRRRIKVWRLTPLRTRIATFRFAHKEKELGDCFEIANSMVRQLRWNKEISTSEYISELQKTRWVFHTYLGLLMFAALPIQDEDEILDQEGLERTAVVELPPSSTAIGRRSIKIRQSKWHYFSLAEASKIFHPMKYPHKALTRFTQTNYLDLVLVILRVLAKQRTLVPTGWLIEIMRVQRTIREAREAMRSMGMVPSERRKSWAGVWDFKVPLCDPSDKSRWDDEQSEVRKASE
ncbi:hypothetical protein F5Y03DRAFT_351449 [Xylaria venustula]|nr:hypothetical protein F5Y03DRAFT_351449 [Xylaria venustula]